MPNYTQKPLSALANYRFFYIKTLFTEVKNIKIHLKIISVVFFN